VQGYPHFHGPVDDVVVGHNVAVGRDDDTAADAVLNLLALLRLLPAHRALRTEELREGVLAILIIGALSLHVRRLFGSARSDGNVDHCRRYARRYGFCGLVKSQQGIDAGIVDGRVWSVRGRGGVDVFVRGNESTGRKSERKSNTGSGETLGFCS
jgi:hypothetical protein